MNENNEYLQEVLLDINNCQSTCSDIAHVCADKQELHDVDWLVQNIPSMNYTRERLLNYLFSNGMTSGSDEDNLKLDKWLYESTNKTGSTNYSVLREAIGQAVIYGECGLRMFEGNLYAYRTGHFGILYTIADGVQEVMAYYIRKDGSEVDEDIQPEDINEYNDIVKWFDEKGLILLDPSEFENLRNNTEELHGKSPFLYDKLRVQLLLSVYKRLNYDIEYDGPGRIIVRPKMGYEEAEEGKEASTTAVLSTVSSDKYEQMLKEVRRVSREIKTSSSDSVIVLSNGFSEKIDHLPRVTKATEFFTWLDNEGVIVSQLLGMSPVLMEVGKWSGNVSMSSIIDNAMLNTIIPMREQYAIQFSKLISRTLGISKVYFDKYEMTQAEDDTDERMKVAAIIKDLAYAAKAAPNEQLENLITTLTDVMNRSLYDDQGNLRPL